MSRTGGNNMHLDRHTADTRTRSVNERHSGTKRDSGSARLMKACRYSRKLYAGLPRAAYLHGKQSLARLSDVLILWKQFLRRCASDKDAAVSGVVVCTEGKGINQHDRKTGILSPRWWINGRNVARNVMRASLCYTFGEEYYSSLISTFCLLYYCIVLQCICCIVLHLNSLWSRHSYFSNSSSFNNKFNETLLSKAGIGSRLTGDY